MSDVVHQSRYVKIEQSPGRVVCSIKGGSNRHIFGIIFFVAIPITYHCITSVRSIIREYHRASPHFGDIAPSVGAVFILTIAYIFVLYRLIAEERKVHKIVIENSRVTVETPDFPTPFHQFPHYDLASCKLQNTLDGKVRLIIMTRKNTFIKASREHAKEVLEPVVDILNQYVTPDRHYAFEVVTSPEAPKPAMPVLPVEPIDE